MPALAGALLAMLVIGPNLPAAGGLAVTLQTHPRPRSCAVVSTATIVAYDASARRAVAYRFVHSDGSVSASGRLTFAGEGALAQSVRDEWTPRGASSWVVLEITAPERVRSQRIAARPHCPRRIVAATR
jgi:hypothetical protein